MMLDILSIWLSNFIKFQNAILFFRNCRKNPSKNVTRRNLRNVKQIRPFHISAESRYVFSIFQARSGYVLSLLVLDAHTPFPYQAKFQIRPFHSSATIWVFGSLKVRKQLYLIAESKKVAFRIWLTAKIK